MNLTNRLKKSNLVLFSAENTQEPNLGIHPNSADLHLPMDSALSFDHRIDDKTMLPSSIETENGSQKEFERVNHVAATLRQLINNSELSDSFKNLVNAIKEGVHRSEAIEPVASEAVESSSHFFATDESESNQEEAICENDVIVIDKEGLISEGFQSSDALFIGTGAMKHHTPFSSPRRPEYENLQSCLCSPSSSEETFDNEAENSSNCDPHRIIERVLQVSSAHAPPYNPINLTPICITPLFSSIISSNYEGSFETCRPAFTTNELGIVGAIATNDPESNHNSISFFTWNENGIFPNLRNQTKKTRPYKGKNWQVVPDDQNVGSHKKAKYLVSPGEIKFCVGPSVSAAVLNPAVSELAWLDQNQLLVASGSGDTFQLRIVRTELTPKEFKTRINSKTYCPQRSEIREMVVKDSRMILFGGEDMRLELLHSPRLNASKVTPTTTWNFEAAVGSIRWNRVEPWIASCTTDDGHWHQVDTRDPIPAFCLETGPDCFSHDTLSEYHFVVGTLDGIISAWDSRYLNAPLYAVQDRSATVIGDLFYEPELGQIRVFGQPGMSIWSTDGVDSWSAVYSSTIDTPPIEEHHTVIGRSVPNSSLLIAITDSGKMALFDP